MALRWKSVVGLLCGWGSAVVWSIGLTVFQPDTEPVKPWHDEYASNNVYWARDLRWMAILAALVAVVLAVQGNRVRSGAAVLGTLGWFGLDLYLDRIDMAGATLWLALAAGAVITIAMAVAAWHADNARSDSRILVLAAPVAAALTPIAGGLESASDTEPGLTPSALAVGSMLAALAIGCALAAVPVVTATRVYAALALAAATAAGLVGLRIVPPGDRFFPMIVLGAILLTGVTVLRRDWPATGAGWAGYLLLALGCLVAYPFLIVVTLLATVGLGGAATAIVGNPPVNAADEDVLYSVAGLAAGLVFGAVSLAAGRMRRPVSTSLPHAVR